jgi:hypothetical protein
MAFPAIPPLASVPVDQAVAALPKADLHLHQEAAARLECLAASRQRRPPYDRRGWAARLIAEWPPGLDRLGGVYEPDDGLDLTGIQRGDPEHSLRRKESRSMRARSRRTRYITDVQDDTTCLSE